MPAEGMQWWHIVISTHKSWLPGDKRGFRSRDHKVHSSGDYKKPPAIEEHAGLRAYHEQRSDGPVLIPDEQREVVGKAILDKLKKLGYRFLALSVSATHSHCLVELPRSLEETRAIIGQCKSKSSHAVRSVLPGQVWAGRGKYLRIKDRQHHRNVYRYILNQKDAWIWDFAQEEPQREDPSPESTEAVG